jgi:drug/metabolite transporter (DMT)-like permease
MLEALTRRTTTSAVAGLVLTMALWAGNHVVGRWATGQIPPMTFAFFRWSGAGLVILPFALASLRQDWHVIRANLPIMITLGILGSGIYNTLQYIALTGTTATNAGILNSWGPVLIAAGGAIVFKDHLRPIQIGGLALSLFGVAAIILHGDPERLATLTFNRGDLIMLFATGVWATYTTLLRKRPAITTMAFAGFTYIFAGLLNAPLAAYEYANGQYVVWSWATVAAIVYAAIPASVIGYFLYARGVEIIGATRAGAFIHFIPLFVSIMAMTLIGETPQLYHVAGFALILGGVALASRKQAIAATA